MVAEDFGMRKDKRQNGVSEDMKDIQVAFTSYET